MPKLKYGVTVWRKRGDSIAYAFPIECDAWGGGTEPALPMIDPNEWDFLYTLPKGHPVAVSNAVEGHRVIIYISGTSYYTADWALQT